MQGTGEVTLLMAHLGGTLSHWGVVADLRYVTGRFNRCAAGGAVFFSPAFDTNNNWSADGLPKF